MSNDSRFSYYQPIILSDGMEIDLGITSVYDPLSLRFKA